MQKLMSVHIHKMFTFDVILLYKASADPVIPPVTGTMSS